MTANIEKFITTLSTEDRIARFRIIANYIFSRADEMSLLDGVQELDVISASVEAGKFDDFLMIQQIMDTGRYSSKQAIILRTLVILSDHKFDAYYCARDSAGPDACYSWVHLADETMNVLCGDYDEGRHRIASMLGML